MLFCPRCGDRSLHNLSGTQYQCQACDFVVFHNVAAAVAVAIVCGDEMLVATRAKDPCRGMWDLPGGFVDPDESTEQAATRELAEELGFECDQFEYVGSCPNTYVYRDVTYKTCDAVLVTRLSQKPAMQAGDDVAHFEWVKISEISAERFAFDSSRMALSWLINQN